MSKQEVDRFYPNGIEDYSQIVQDDHRRRWQRGDWTDDTDMMLCILDSFVACQKVDILDIARRFKKWMMNGGMGIGRHTYCLDDEKSMGYTLRTLGAVLWAYWHATSYKEGILKIVLSGGDADTNVAVAGAILGAKFGINPIPEEWKSGLLYASMLHNKVQDLYSMV